jgi:hypothetical protein
MNLVWAREFGLRILDWKERTMNKLKIALFVLLIICISPVQASAGDFDGSKNLLFASIQVFECEADAKCDQVTAEEVGFVQFLKINFKKKEITGTRKNGMAVTSKIKNVESSEGMLMLQGVEYGRAWSLAITQATGNATMSAAGDRESFVVFGACIPD